MLTWVPQPSALRRVTVMLITRHWTDVVSATQKRILLAVVYVLSTRGMCHCGRQTECDGCRGDKKCVPDFHPLPPRNEVVLVFDGDTQPLPSSVSTSMSPRPK